MSITTYTDLELRLQAEVAALKSDNENLRAYAKHERSLGAEAFAMENLDLTQQVEILKAKLDKWMGLPMKYKRMEFNAQLQAENVALKKELAEYLPKFHQPYAWRNPMNGAVIDNRKKNQLGIGNGYPNFSEPLYTKGTP